MECLPMRRKALLGRLERRHHNRSERRRVQGIRRRGIQLRRGRDRRRGIYQGQRVLRRSARRQGSSSDRNYP